MASKLGMPNKGASPFPLLEKCPWSKETKRRGRGNQNCSSRLGESMILKNRRMVELSFGNLQKKNLPDARLRVWVFGVGGGTKTNL